MCIWGEVGCEFETNPLQVPCNPPKLWSAMYIWKTCRIVTITSWPSHHTCYIKIGVDQRWDIRPQVPFVPPKQKNAIYIWEISCVYQTCMEVYAADTFHLSKSWSSMFWLLHPDRCIVTVISSLLHPDCCIVAIVTSTEVGCSYLSIHLNQKAQCVSEERPVVNLRPVLRYRPQ